MKVIPFRTAITFCMLLSGNHAVGNDVPVNVQLHYYERPPPLHYTDAQSRPSGLIVKRTKRIFNKAGITYAWQVTPANRILALIKNSPGKHCTPGWYKNPERAEYALISDPIYW